MVARKTEQRRGMRATIGADLRVFQIKSVLGPLEDLQWMNFDNVLHFDFKDVGGGDFVLEFFFIRGASLISAPFTAAQLPDVAKAIQRLIQRPGGEANLIP